jgi:hypothetical protein
MRAMFVRACPPSKQARDGKAAMHHVWVILDRTIKVYQLARRSNRQRRARRARTWGRVFGLGAAVG